MMKNETTNSQSTFPVSDLAKKYCIGKGLEIGGSAHNPFDLDTRNVDFCDSMETVYKKEEVHICGKALPVDIVALGDDIPLPNESQDFIVSSHVLEHFPNPIKALIEWDRLVKTDGIIFMIVPHKERTFDSVQPRTTLQHIVDDYYNNATKPHENPQGHDHCWITKDIVDLCTWMIKNLGVSWDIIDIQDVDDKVGNGFTIVIRKKGIRLPPLATVRIPSVASPPLIVELHETARTIATQINILVVVHNFPPHNFAGVEVYTHQFVKTLMTRGYNVTIFYPLEDDKTRENYLDESVYDGINIVRLRYSRRFSDFADQISAEASEKIFRQFLGRHQFDVIHFQHVLNMPISYISIAEAFCSSVFVTLHDFWLICETVYLYNGVDKSICTGPESFEKCAACICSRDSHDLNGPMFNYLNNFFETRIVTVKKILSNVTCISAPSNYVADKFKKYGFSNSVVVAPLGIKLLPNSTKQLDPNQVVFGFLGTIQDVKNIFMLAEIFKDIRGEARLLIFGQGGLDNINHLKKIIESDNRIEYCGAYQPHQLSEIVSLLDMVVMPSRLETFGLAVREALSAGVPVIASKLGGLSEIVRHQENGILFDPANRQELRYWLQFVVDNPGMIEEMKCCRTNIISIDNDVDGWTNRYLNTIKESADACGRVCSGATLSHFPTDKRLNITILSTDHQEHACGYYRVVSPMRALKDFVDFSWGLELRGHQYHVVPEAFKSADMFVVQRFFPQPETMVVLDYICSLGKPIIYEIDDLLTQLPQTNPCYSLGVAGAEYIYSFLEKASALTVSTEELKRQFSTKHASIYVLPNMLNNDLWCAISPPTGGTIVIGYAGTITHGKDLELVETVLEQIAQCYGSRVTFLFMGCVTERIKRLPGMSYLQFEETYEKYAKKLQKTQIDIMLVPLEDNPFNRCKSNIKWLEYSSCGIAGIYSDLAPYNTCIKHGETGLLVENSSEQWFQAICLLIEHPELRKKMAQQARQKVLSEYSLHQGAYRWERVYREVVAKHRSNELPQASGSVQCETSDIRQGAIDMSPAVVSIIVPVFNKLHFTQRCLQTLFDALPPAIACEIIVIDNASSDGTDKYLQTLSNRVRVVSNVTNLGFAKACNQGASGAKGRYLLFLNNDTEPQPGWLEPMIEMIESEESIGAVGSKLLFPDGTIQHAGVLVIEDQKMPDLLAARHIFYGQRSDTPHANRPMEYKVLTAACLMIRRDLFEDVGGFDEGYWNGDEDVDLCFKLGEKGWRLAYQPASVLIHHESKSGKERFTQVEHNINRLHEKWLGKIRPDAVIDKEGAWHWIQDDASWHALRETSATLIDKGPQGRCLPGLVSIIILTWNQLNYTKACLASIQSHTTTPYEIIFVDNGSNDGTVEWLREQAAHDQHIKLIENSSNLGFARGCNQGILASTGSHVVLLNNDTVVTPEWLTGMRELLDRYPEAGIVGPMTNSASGVQVVAAPGYRTREELIVWAVAFRENNRYRIISQRRIVGFCMLFRRELAETIGLLDETFGSGNFEDDDYCLRAELAGYINMIAGDVFVHHTGGATFSGNQVNFAQAMVNNHQLFNEKWDPNCMDEATLRRWLVLVAVEEGERLFQKGFVDEAVQILIQKGIKADSSSGKPYIALAEILIAAARFEEALEVLAEFPEGSRAFMPEYEAICYAALGNDTAAAQAVERALSVGMSTRVLGVKGALAARCGETERAENLFRQAIETDPSYGNSWLSLGMLLWGQGKQEEAWQAVKRAVTVDPLSDEAIKILRDMAERLG